MHIDSVTIRNFRNFMDCTARFTEGFQTIIGENNVGKTNLLFAIRLVLDRALSFKVRSLQESDFHGFASLAFDSHIIVSVSFFGKGLADLPCFHALKTSDDTMRVTYVYAHKQKLTDVEDAYEKPEIKDFVWQLYGGEDLELDSFKTRQRIHLSDLEGLNIEYVSDFRNIYRDLMGSNSSLLSTFCKSRKDSEQELVQLKAMYCLSWKMTAKKI